MSTKFFTESGAQNKRKRAPGGEGPKKRFALSKPTGKGSSRAANPAKSAPAPKKSRRGDDDESISGSDSETADSIEEEEAPESGSDLENEGETAAEKRLRLAERYLDNIKQEVEEVGFNAEDVDRDIIADRLREDVAESKGKVFREVASNLAFEKSSHCLFRWNGHSTTAVAVCLKTSSAYTVTKDMSIIRWRLRDLPKNQYPQTTKNKPKKTAPPRRQPEKVAILKGNRAKSKDKDYQGHTGEILAVAASQDGKFLVTGGTDKKLIVHDATTLKPIKVFGHGRNDHRDSITSLVFRRGSNQLFSASKDRTVKVWSLDELAYVETLFGHQDEVVNIDALSAERCVSVGARDRTARLWKVVEESQLVFRGGGGVKKHKSDTDPKSMAHEGSMDRIAQIDEDLFVTGSDNGQLALWSIQKKKPLHIVPAAHGHDPALLPSEASAEKNPDPSVIPPPQPRWITALRTLPYSDLILSGSWDGHVRCWKLSEDKKRIEPVGIIGQIPPPDSTDPEDVAIEDADEAPGTNGSASGTQTSWSIRGVINDLALFERGERGKDGVCVVAAVGKEHRLGRWKHIQAAKNGAYVFEIPRITRTISDGDAKEEEAEE